MLDGSKKNAFKVEAENIIKGASLAYSNDMLYGTPKSCYSLNELSDYIDKDLTNYHGSVYINKEYNTYQVYLSNGKYIVDGSNKGNIEVKESTTNASETCDSVLVYKETILNGAYPRLDSGMIPVNISTTGAVTKADMTSSTWYSYGTRKEWANAILVKTDGTKTREYYQDAEPNEPIAAGDILAYFVWIPRYKYQMFNANGSTTRTPATYAINIIFESRSTPKSDGKIDGVYTNDEYLTHPAFTFGSEELNGIWVGKFETTGVAAKPTILPGVTSLRSQNVSTQFITSLKFGGGSYNNGKYTYSGSNEYGLTHISHMAQDKDWGAVAYLTHSIYGRCASATSCEEISINNAKDTFITGSSAGRPGDATTNGDIIYAYNTTQGYLASTTVNIYGIYDMSGGSWEYTMSVLNNYSGTCNYYNSGYNGLFGDPDGKANCNTAILDKSDGVPLPESKYYTTYTTTNYQTACNGIACYGSGLKETAGWFGDYAGVVSDTYPWGRRGGGFDNGVTAGLWRLNNDAGYANRNNSFRTIIGM